MNSEKNILIRFLLSAGRETYKLGRNYQGPDALYDIATHERTLTGDLQKDGYNCWKKNGNENPPKENDVCIFFIYPQKPIDDGLQFIFKNNEWKINYDF